MDIVDARGIPQVCTGFLPHEIRDLWVEAVNALARDVEDWSHEHGWLAVQSEHQLSEAKIGPYTIPQLEIHGPEDKLILEPIARYGPGADGRVDLYAYPSYYRVQL